MPESLVLFWGWARDEKSYQGLMDSASKDWNIYSISYEDLIPNGRLDQLKENALKFLDENNLDQAYFLGHSLGGALALEFARHYPDKVKQLFLIDSEGVYDGKSLLGALWHVVIHSHSKATKSSQMLGSLFRSLRNPVLHARLGHFAHHVDLQKEAAEVTVPTTIIWGENDMITPVEQGQRLHELIKESRLIVLPNQGHDWILHSPQLFWENI